MPELPDIELYIHALRERIEGQPLKNARLKSVFLLRTVEPPLDALFGRKVEDFRRIGKRIVFDLGDELFMVFHLMIAGRFQWKKVGAKLSGRDLAAFDFPEGTLVMTEASKKKRAKLHVVKGEDALADHDPGGIDPLTASVDAFAEALRARNHTVKRALTDPRIFSGIGNGVLRRDPLRGEAPTTQVDLATHRRGGRAPPRRGRRDASRMDQTSDRRARWEVAQKGDGVPAGHEGARKVRRALRAVWGEDPARLVCE